jgi:hypothetical protein
MAKDHRYDVRSPILHGLALWGHRLAAQRLAETRQRVSQVHEAALRYGAQDKAEPPDHARSDGSSTSSELRSLSWSRPV